MDRYNHEGYPDPTASATSEAVAHAEKAERCLPLVYIASPFAGDTERNIIMARHYCRVAVSKGCVPLAPHLLYPQFMDDADKTQRELGIRFALILLDKCDELWCFGGKVSLGMAIEIAKATYCGIPVRYFNDECKEVTVCGT